MYCGPATLRANIEVIMLTKHEEVVLACGEVALQVWFQSEDKTIMATNIL